MYTRALSVPDHSFFFFGPRGTGKSTWLRTHRDEAFFIDLLSTELVLELQKNPSLLREMVLDLPKERWIVVDEVQKCPELLDEVHHLIENEGYSLFALTGSSARKLKYGAANLLAGRALTRTLFPLTIREIGYSVEIEKLLRFGQMPASINAPNDELREDFLEAYVRTYLQEEIKAEALVRNIGTYARFVELAALCAAQRVNISGLARDSGISRDTLRGYFQVFEDTLMGSWLPAYRPRAKVKETQKPKFYWFDIGVLTAAANGFKQPLPRDWSGIALEHLVYHEIRAYLEYSRTKGTLGYWGTPGKSEIDFLWWYGDVRVGIEAKAARSFRKEFLKGFRSFEESKPLKAKYIVYKGDRRLALDDGTRVMPVLDFLRDLHAGKVFAA